ncbi:hypothetical protein [Kosakonia sp. SMBL-WEM22]|uniref:hypothetical protein n=1 Tax=Kosakonia sp. SMBL-WEM22 TaxID=2725560 RepID=UPI001CB91C76|nr:hypothetical protein [Kosakonia sp. SMBL-WEM22]
MRYECNEVLNDLVNYFLLADIRLLKKFKDDNNLADDLATEFTRNESGDKAVLEGVLIPMTGVENYPYTIIFTLPPETPELLKAENNLQHRRPGYTLRVAHGQVQLFTWRILDDFTDKRISALLQRYEAPNRPHIALKMALTRWRSLQVRCSARMTISQHLSLCWRKTTMRNPRPTLISTIFLASTARAIN